MVKNYFKTSKQKQELYALLNTYDLYKNIVCCYLDNPTNPLNKELNIFYMRELVPSILKLIENLKLDYLIAKKLIKLPKKLALFPNLFSSEKILQDEGKDSKQARIELFNTYGQIKELVEEARAVLQDPIPEIEEVINKGKDLISELNITRYQEKSLEVAKPKEENNKIVISYKIGLGQLIFNDFPPVTLEGKQKDTADCLVNAGKDKKVSWDEIYEIFKDVTTDQDLPNPTELDAQKRSVRTAVNGINNHAKNYLQQKQDFIGAKGNEYWLQYEVDKGR